MSPPYLYNVTPQGAPPALTNFFLSSFNGKKCCWSASMAWFIFFKILSLEPTGNYIYFLIKVMNVNQLIPDESITLYTYFFIWMRHTDVPFQGNVDQQCQLSCIIDKRASLLQLRMIPAKRYLDKSPFAVCCQLTGSGNITEMWTATPTLSTLSSPS